MNNSKKEKDSDVELSTIHCFCGAKIMLVPKVKLMGEAIEAHAEKHKRKVKDPAEADKGSRKSKGII